MTSERLALLGRDHRLFTSLHGVASVDGRIGLAISPGGLPDERFFASKGDRAFPNEDACCAVDDGRRVLVAVADAHFGRGASEVLIDALAHAEPPGDAAGLDRLLEQLGRLPACAERDSSTTLIIAVLDRQSRRGHAVSFGDSSLLLVVDRGARRALPRGRSFVKPGAPLGPPEARLEWSWEPGQLVVLHSDGVDEAFGDAGGVTPTDVARLAEEVAGGAEALARAVVRTALAGSGEVEGGRDNLAVVVVAS